MRAALPALALLLAVAASAQTDAVRLNGAGFPSEGAKVAVVVSPSAAGTFEVVRDADGAVVLSGTLGPARTWAASGETARQADLSALTAPGRYTLRVGGVGEAAFTVGAGAADDVARSVLKGFYYMRASTALPAAYAGPWARAAGHPDTDVVVHPSAATAARPAGSRVSSPRGWYDAGDYNKYVPNAAFAVGTLLDAFEREPAYVASIESTIPERGGAVPDALDEVLWTVRWMLTMQDADGGVYHKLTDAAFGGVVMPADAVRTRYVVQKSTGAALRFAASMAQASRVAAAYSGPLPGLADSLRTAALGAWGWARANPDRGYDQAAMNAAFDPDIRTGEYATNLAEDLDWAATELYLTTRDPAFLAARQPLTSPALFEGGTRELAQYSLLRFESDVAGAVDLGPIRDGLLGFADWLATYAEGSAYGVSQGAGFWHFRWGSNAMVARQGVALATAYQITGDERYRRAATAALDYLLGRNATGYSFVTGLGTRQLRFPHHGQSLADGVDAPVPGLMTGGPNEAQQDVAWGDCPAGVYPSALPARSFADHPCAYASNETSIHYNAAVFNLAVAVRQLYPPAPKPPAPPAVETGVWYTLRNVDREQYLDADGGGAVALKGDANGLGKQWEFVAAGAGAYRIDNRRAGRGPLDTNGSGRIRWAADGATGSDKAWTAVDAGDGTFRFQNAAAGRGYLVGNADGSVRWTASAGAGTRWRLARVGGAVAQTGLAHADVDATLPGALTLASVGPNPTRGALRVRFGVPEAAEVSVAVYDVRGRRVVQQTEAAGAGWHGAEVPTAALSPGVYVVRLTAGAETATRTFTVVR